MKKRKSFVGLCMVILIFIIAGCSNNKNIVNKVDAKKESDFTNFEKDLDKLGMDMKNIIFGMLDNNLDQVNLEALSLESDAASTEKKLSDSKASNDFKTDLSNLLSLYDDFAKQISNGDFNVNDLSSELGTKNKELADKYNNGVLPNSLATFNDRFEEKLAELEKQAEELANKVYSKGEYWEVENQWKLTVNSVVSTEARNQFSHKDPAQVVIVDYSYENLGYTNDIQDLFITPSNIIDSTGQMGDSYPATVNGHPKPTPVGATTSNAQYAFGLKTAGEKVKVTFSIYDSNNQKQTGIFEIPVE